MTITYFSQRFLPLNLRYSTAGTANSITPEAVTIFIRSLETVKIPARFSAHAMTRITAQVRIT